MYTKTYILVLVGFLLCTAFTCENNSEVNELIDDANSSIDGVLGNSGEKWSGKLDQLLTLDIAAQVLGFNKSKAEKQYSKVLENPATHYVSYKWDNGREVLLDNEYMITPMMIPEQDFIQLSWVRSTTLADFKSSYRTPTQEELAQMDAAMNQKLAEMEADGKIDKSHANIANNLASDFSSNISYTHIPNLGEYALWNDKDKNLKVYYQGMEFQITIVNGDNETEKRKKCVEAARLVLKKL